MISLIVHLPEWDRIEPYADYRTRFMLIFGKAIDDVHTGIDKLGKLGAVMTAEQILREKSP